MYPAQKVPPVSNATWFLEPTWAWILAETIPFEYLALTYRCE
jgi:hypothetical protein